MKNTGYLKGLDGIRALAIILIIAYHYWPAGNKILKGGFIGVEIFFVISGFIITHILLEEWEKKKKIDLANFWIHRIRRLLPALIALLLVVIFSAAIAPGISTNAESSGMTTLAKFVPDFENELSALKYQAVTGLFYVINWYFIFQGKSYFEMTDRPPLFGHLWSLSIEEQFYIFWPLFLILILKLGKNKKVFPVIACLAIFAFSVAMMIVKGHVYPNDSRAYFGTDTRIYSLMAGSILAFLFGQISKLANSGRFLKSIFEILGIASLTVIIFISFTLEGGELIVFRGGLLCVSIATCFLIISVVCIKSSKLGIAVFESSIARLIGQRSYGLYLWHWPIFILTEPEYNYQIDGLGLFFIRMITLVVITEISLRFIENPIRRGFIGDLIGEIRIERGHKRQRLMLKAGIPLLAFIGLVGFCSVSVLNFDSKEVLSLVQASANETEKTSIDISSEAPSKIPSEIPIFIKPDSAEKSIQDEPKKENDKIAKKEKSVKILAIGDSVMLGAKKALEDSIENLKVDAVVSRQFSETYRIIKKLKKKEALPPFVIIHSGTNGGIDEKEFIGMMNDLSGCQTVVIFNLRVPRKWQDCNNRIINSVVPRYKNAILVDWHGESWCRREVFRKDGLHLKCPKGTTLYVRLAKQALAGQQSK